MISKISPQEAAEATKKILGFYPEIPASDPKGFTAGLLQTLLIYPKAVVDRAVDPVRGIPGEVQYLNLAKIRKLLEDWDDEYRLELKRRELPPKRLAAPPEDPEVQKRIQQGLRDLSNRLKAGFGPSTAS